MHDDYYNAQAQKLQNLLQKIQEVVNKPFTQRRMDENIETDEQIEFKAALKQIIEYENMLMECLQNIQFMNDTIKEVLEKKEISHEEQINEKQNEISYYIRRCDELQEQNHELTQKNCTLVNSQEYLEDLLNRQKEVQRNLELEITQLNNAFNEKKVLKYIEKIRNLQIRERQISVYQLQEENQQQSQKQQQVLQRQKTDFFDLQERYNNLQEQTTIYEKQYQDSLREIEGLKKGNYSLKEINETLKVEIIKLLDEKDLFCHSYDQYKVGIPKNNEQNSYNGDNEKILSNDDHSFDKKHINYSHQSIENSKNQYETMQGELMNDYNKNQKHDQYSKSAKYIPYQNSHYYNSLASDSNKFQSNEKTIEHLFNLENQLSQFKKEEILFEGFDPQTHRSLDSQMSMNFISNFHKETNTQIEQQSQFSQYIISQQNLYDHQNPDKFISSQKNSKSPQLSVRSSFESPRINQFYEIYQNSNKIYHGKEVNKKPKYCQEEEKIINEKEIHQNQIKFVKQQKQTNKRHQYLSIIPTCKSNSSNESLEDQQDQKEQNEDNQQNKKQELQTKNFTHKNQVINMIDCEQQQTQYNYSILLKQDAETQTTQQEMSKEKSIQITKKEQKENLCQKCKNQEQGQQNESLKEVKMQMPCIKCNNTAQDPYHSAKLNSRYRDDVIDFDMKPFYSEIKERLPLNEWYQWIKQKLNKLRIKML